MRRFRLSLFAALSTIAACARTKVSVLEPARSRTPTCEQAIAVYATPASAPAGYHEVALIQSTGGALTTSSAQMQRSMRAKAASVGATGLILGGIEAPSAASTIARTTVGWPAYREGMGLAVFSESDSARVAMACAEKQR
jgi:hypothetical protein